MKRLVLLIILSCVLLCACSDFNKSREEKKFLTGAAIASNPVSSTSVAVSGEVITHLDAPVAIADRDSGAQKGNNEKTKVQTVIDPTGKKRKLKLGDVDISNKEIPISEDSSVEYAQVADGHYYYLRKGGESDYTLYCDKGERIGSFGIEEGYYFQGCCKYGDRFYVVLYRCDEYKAGTTVQDEYSVLTVADFSGGELRMLRRIENLKDYDASLYKDKIRLYYSPDEIYDDWEEDGKEYEEIEKGMTYEYDMTGNREPFYDEEYQNYIIDGNCYYAKAGEEVHIIRQDIKSKKKEEVFCYRSKRKNPGKDVEIGLDMDREYLFIEERGSEHLLYVVPRSGGKMKLVTDQLTWRGYVYNDQYIFWMDNPCRIHRWNRKTQKEEKMIETPLSQNNYLWELRCTEEGLYIQECGLKNKKYDRPGYKLYYKGFSEEKYETVWDDKEYVREEEYEDWVGC